MEINLNEPALDRIWDAVDQKELTAGITAAMVRNLDPDCLLTLQQAGDIMGVSVYTVRKMIEEGVLPVTYVGTSSSTPRVARMALTEYIKANTQTIKM